MANNEEIQELRQGLDLNKAHGLDQISDNKIKLCGNSTLEIIKWKANVIDS